jgi:hypothetical protein
MTNEAQDFAISERNLRRWRTIKMVSLLPLLISVALMIFFKGSMLGMAFFFLILIVGIILPQICENQVRSHLVLMNAIESMQKKANAPE